MRVLLENVNGDPFRHVDGSDTSGQNLFVREITRCLMPRVDQVDVSTRATCEDDPVLAENEHNLRIWRISAGPPSYLFRDEVEKYLEIYIQGLIAAMSQRDITYDIVHGNYWLSAPVALAIREAGLARALVYTPHSLGQWKMQQVGISPKNRFDIECSILSQADVVHVLSEDEETCLRSMYPETSGRVIRAGHGVDLSMFRFLPKCEARRTLGWDQCEKCLLFVGRFEPQKNLPAVLRAFKHVASNANGPSSTSWRLVVCGGPTVGRPKIEDLPEEIREVLASTRRSHGIDLSGRVPHEELPLLYAASDFLVAPSQYEPFGLVAAEALACGLPVIAARTGGLRETVRDGVDGRLFPAGNETAFLHTLMQVLDEDQWMNTEYRKAIAARAAKRLAWDNVANELHDTYVGALDRSVVV